MIGLVQHIRDKVPDPHDRVYVVQLLLDVDSGHVRLTADQRTALKAELERTAEEEL